MAIFQNLNKGHSIEIAYIWILYVYFHTLFAFILEYLMIISSKQQNMAVTHRAKVQYCVYNRYYTHWMRHVQLERRSKTVDLITKLDKVYKNEQSSIDKFEVWCFKKTKNKKNKNIARRDFNFKFQLFIFFKVN